MRKRALRILGLFLLLVTLFTAMIGSAYGLTWDGSTSGGSAGTSDAGPNGYAIRYTEDYNMLGYRFSVVDKTGANKVSKVIDVFRKTSNAPYGDYAYANEYKFSAKYNKKQLITRQNSGFSTVKTSTNCYKENSMGFATELPMPSGLKAWQNNTTNLNKILSALGVGSVSNLKNGDKILVEPLYDVRLESIYHSVTVTEIALYGKHILGASSDGGSSGNSASWGFISRYTNKNYPNSLFTPDGQGLWTGVSASSSRLTFYNIINKGYGAGIAYTETRPDFSPALSVVKCEAWPGATGTRSNNHYGISTGSTLSDWLYGHGYPCAGDTLWYAVNFPAETENCYVKQSVWVVGGDTASRCVWSDGNTWYDVSLAPTTVDADTSYLTVKARADWIESNGTVKKYGTEKTFYIPIRPVVTRDKVSAYNEEGVRQAFSGAAGTDGKLYFGQKVTFQYQYGAETTWESSNTVTAGAKRWSGSGWAYIYADSSTGYDVSAEKVGLSSTKPCTKNSAIGAYIIPLPADDDDENGYKLQFNLTTAWTSDTAHTSERSTYYLPLVKSDVALSDIKLVNSDGYYVDRNDLTVGDELTIHYFYKNNTDCTVYVKGYNDGGSEIGGVFAILAGETIEVAGRSYTVPDQRSFSIWGGVYLDTVARGNVSYETNGSNNQWLAVCKSSYPLTLTAVTPNAPYRESTTVISSFLLHNQSSVDRTPDSSVPVRLQIYRQGETEPFLSLTKDAVVPANSSNLVYFKWDVPTGLDGAPVTLCADVWDGSKYASAVSNARDTVPYTCWQTPDTRYEEKAPTGYAVPDTPSSQQVAASWSIYEYTDGAFVQKNYCIAISSSAANHIAPATGSTAEQTGDQWTMRSGYGISLQSDSSLVSRVGFDVPDASSYTKPQYAYALLPEYGYFAADGKAVTLIRERSGSRLYFAFPQNGQYGKVHFTPLWYPDGAYTAEVVQSDCWTPVGMICTHLVTNSINIRGSAYDDWYVGRR